MTSPSSRAELLASALESLRRGAAAQAAENAQVAAGEIVRGAKAIADVAGIGISDVYYYHKRAGFPVRKSGAMLIARRRDLEVWAARRAKARLKRLK